MDDRELLELAAKAAGYTVIEFQSGDFLEIRYGLTEAIWNGDNYWNPLTDDGDALRLAVKLELTVKIELHEVEVFDADGCLVSIALDKQEDPYAATRRAIVRAAAEIGKPT